MGNACDATDEKRRAAQEAGAAADYMPTLLLTTRRGDDHVEVRIRDNGSRHAARSRREDLQPLLHHQADRPRHRPGPRHLPRHRAEARRLHPASSPRPGEFTEMVVRLPLVLAREEAPAV